MRGRSETGGRLLARNSVVNLASQALPVIMALLFIPPVLRGLGTERFGILALAWTVIGFFSLFDLGLSRAMTKHAAQAIGAGEREKLPGLFGSTLIVNSCLGVVGGAVLALLAPVLTGGLFRVPEEMMEEAREAFLALAAVIPLILVTTVLRGMLEAGQRFDRIAMVQAPANSMLFILPAVGLHLGLGLPGIVLLLVISRLGAVVAYVLFCRRTYPGILGSPRLDLGLLGPLVRFGGWVTVGNAVGPVLMYLDRFVIGSLISMAAVAYYAAPYEIALRLMIVPTSMIAVLFPAFSSMGSASLETAAELYARAVKFLLVIMGPVVLVLILLAKPILGLWLGPEFAERSAPVFQIIAAGILLTPVQVSVSLLHGLGRPDLTAKFYLIELALYVPLVYFLTSEFGIVGAALAWTIRALIDTLLLLAASTRLCRMGARCFSENGLLRAMGAFAVFAGCLVLTHLLGVSTAWRVAASISGVALFSAVAWFFVFDAKDRAVIVPFRTR